MPIRRLALLAIMCAGWLLSPILAQQRRPTRSLEYPSPLVREEQTITVDGNEELWRLEWATKPKEYCEPSDESLTCPCMGFAFGETGEFSAVRLRDGVQIDRLDLTPFFRDYPGKPVVQRWPTKADDLKIADRVAFPQVVRRRLPVQVMHFADYDHDGRATEFYLQTEILACGKSYGIVVGISKTEEKLHVFGMASHPETPLYLQKREWEALLGASCSVKVTDWQCGDHGSETPTELHLALSVKGIDATCLEYSCPSQGEKRRLLRRKPSCKD